MHPRKLKKKSKKTTPERWSTRVSCPPKRALSIAWTPDSSPTPPPSPRSLNVSPREKNVSKQRASPSIVEGTSVVAFSTTSAANAAEKPEQRPPRSFAKKSTPERWSTRVAFPPKRPLNWQWSSETSPTTSPGSLPESRSGESVCEEFVSPSVVEGTSVDALSTTLAANAAEDRLQMPPRRLEKEPKQPRWPTRERRAQRRTLSLAVTPDPSPPSSPSSLAESRTRERIHDEVTEAAAVEATDFEASSNSSAAKAAEKPAKPKKRLTIFSVKPIVKTCPSRTLAAQEKYLRNQVPEEMDKVKKALKVCYLLRINDLKILDKNLLRRVGLIRNLKLEGDQGAELVDRKNQLICELEDKVLAVQTLERQMQQELLSMRERLREKHHELVCCDVCENRTMLI